MTRACATFSAFACFGLPAGPCARPRETPRGCELLDFGFVDLFAAFRAVAPAAFFVPLPPAVLVDFLAALPILPLATFLAAFPPRLLRVAAFGPREDLLVDFVFPLAAFLVRPGKSNSPS
jgi:hypothetical protein